MEGGHGYSNGKHVRAIVLFRFFSFRTLSTDTLVIKCSQRSDWELLCEVANKERKTERQTLVTQVTINDAKCESQYYPKNH